jgi:hypothetical protein
MILMVIKMDDFFFVYGFLIVIIAYFVNKWMTIQDRIAFRKYKIERRKLFKASKSKKKESNDDEENDLEDFIESLPPWLQGISDGAGIDLEKVYYGDQTEIKKIGDIIQKQLPGGTNESSTNAY